ncbi:hypothetical protein GCM10010466_22700 [Planomonospora alba]|uniref:Uncharacterized protein n=1 Tax=Planomonospora alba TaxID=161354 RepID=A0ABP6N098_9ACTN
MLAAAGAVLVCALLWAAFARPRLVPRGLQNLAELGYLFVRDQVARPFLGKDADRWMGLLLSVFLLSWIWSLTGVIPGIQLPVSAYLAFPAVMAVAVYVIKIYVGVRAHGVRGYLDGLVPPGLPRGLYLVLLPMELRQNFATSLFTHMLRPVRGP